MDEDANRMICYLQMNILWGWKGYSNFVLYTF